MVTLNQVEKIQLKKLSKSSYSKQFDFNTGDVLSLKVIHSKTKRRKQNLIGICISKRNRGINSSFTIRSLVDKEGVEHTFPLYSPLLTQIQTLYVKNVKDKKLFRASKLYYLRKYPNETSFTINMYNK